MEDLDIYETDAATNSRMGRDSRANLEQMDLHQAAELNPLHQAHDDNAPSLAETLG